MDKVFERFFGKMGENHQSDFFNNRQPQKKGTLKAAIIVILFFLIAEYFTMLPLNLRSPDFVFFLSFCLIIFVGLRSLFQASFDKVGKVLVGLAAVFIAYVFIGQLISSPIFHASSYQKQLKLDKKADFYADNKTISYQSIPVVDRDSAIKLGDRKMGQMVDYVSQFEVDESYEQINYQDTPYRVTPLEYSDLIKWFTNRSDGLPAYIRVNMVTQESEVVKLKEGMKYSKSEHFGRKIERHLRANYPTLMFDTLAFEIDEKGNPYWIAPVYNYKIGLFGGKDITGAVLVNAINGDHEYYDIDKVPEWVDRAYPAELLIEQYNWSGALSGGWINSWLGQNGVKQTTPSTDGKSGFNYIAQDDDVWVYSGVTSATADNSIIGCVMINQRTAESKFYSVAGATEESAMRSAEGQVQHLQYDATFPLLINVDGQPTYFMALKDAAGLVKMYAMVDIQRYQNVAVGDTLAATEKSYKQLLVSQGINVGGSDASAHPSAGSTSGTIASISPVVLDGNSHYYLILDGQQAIFDCPVASVVDVVRYKVGDVIVLNHGSSEGNVVLVDSIGE